MLATLAAATMLVGGAAWAQSTATPDTGSTIPGLSTGNGRGQTGVGQGQSGTTQQNRGGPANTSKPALGRGAGKVSSHPTTGEKKPVGEEAR
ncbi:MAG TPA: hypothetical protein VHB97_27125 [Polyangia bacterium]|jgi:hypothetical protein|nr:hypothetical protein [Polyangia bacterium]